MPQSIDALKSAAILKNDASLLDGGVRAPSADEWDAVLHPTSDLPEGLGPGTSGLTLRGTEQPERLLGAIDSTSPAMRAAMDALRVRQYGDAAEMNDLASGIPQSLARGEQGVKNAQRDAAAAGEFYPNVEDVYNRDQASKRDLYNAQYVIPATLRAQSDMQTAQIDASGRIAAAQASHPQPTAMSALLKALQDRFANGYPTTPADVAALKAQLNIQ